MSLVNLSTLQSLALLRHARWLSAFAGRCATARLRLIIVEHFDRLSRDPATIQRLEQVLEFNRVELMDQKGVYATATDISIASLYNTISSHSSPTRFGAGTITLSPTEEFPAHTPMVIGRGRARPASE